MKTLLLAGVAALFLATGAAHTVAEPKPNLVIDCRKTEIQYNGDDDRSYGHLSIEDIMEIEKLIPYLKKCNKYWECVKRRGTKWPDGKAWVYPPVGPNAPKHCYPPRWPDDTRLNV